MKIAALYKTHGYEEFLPVSVRAIYDFVEKIVIVHSELSWDGVRRDGANRMFREVLDVDPCNKICIMNIATSSQSEQYAAGFRYLEKIPYDYALIIDADEIWGREQLSKAIQHLYELHPAYKCEMETYIKDFRYRVFPRGIGTPPVFIRRGTHFEGVRGNRTKGIVKLPPDIYFHHFTLIRSDIEKIREKIVLSNLADGMEHVDVDKWMENVWDKIPHVSNFHITQRFRHGWKGIQEVELPDEIKELVYGK